MADDKPTKHPYNFKDLTGQKFGQLTALRFHSRVNGRSLWQCICDCGNEAIVPAPNMHRGHTKTCGRCGYHKARTVKAGTTHGMTDSREYEAWCTAKKRCFNPNCARYKNYGARGITMCPEWIDSFETFYRDMGPRPPGTSLDRIDNDGNYEKNNCHWADRKTQMRNRQNAVRITHNGETLPLKELAERSGIKYATLWARYKHGRPLFGPVREKSYN